ncbi:MAG TPA: hypothetical protein VHS54_04795, partial [Jatrophihabitans sp.]|nr:hypothetical protein [Jatrophihabitans sp.]
TPAKIGSVSASDRGGLLVAFTILFLLSWWTVNHAADTPRFSGGFGSGFSPATRRFWAVVTGVLALAGAILVVVL